MSLNEIVRQRLQALQGGSKQRQLEPVTEESLRRLASEYDGCEILVQLLAEVQQYEQENSRVLGFSRGMRDGEFRLVIRNYGVSVFKRDSEWQSLASRVNSQLLQIEAAVNQDEEALSTMVYTTEDQLALLIAGVKHLYRNLQLRLDRCHPRASLKQLIHDVNSLETYGNETLHMVLRGLTCGNEQLEDSLYDLIHKLVNYLEVHA